MEQTIGNCYISLSCITNCKFWNILSIVMSSNFWRPNRNNNSYWVFKECFNTLCFAFYGTDVGTHCRIRYRIVYSCIRSSIIFISVCLAVCEPATVMKDLFIATHATWPTSKRGLFPAFGVIFCIVEVLKITSMLAISSNLWKRCQWNPNENAQLKLLFWVDLS